MVQERNKKKVFASFCVFCGSKQKTKRSHSANGVFVAKWLEKQM